MRLSARVTAPNRELIEFLEELTERARAGRLQAIAVATICQPELQQLYATTAWSPSGHGYGPEMMIGIDTLQGRFIRERRIF